MVNLLHGWTTHFHFSLSHHLLNVQWIISIAFPCSSNDNLLYVEKVTVTNNTFSPFTELQTHIPDLQYDVLRCSSTDINVYFYAEIFPVSSNQDVNLFWAVINSSSCPCEFMIYFNCYYSGCKQFYWANLWKLGIE